MIATVEAIDLDMLAADMSKMLGRYRYPLDACEDDIRPHLDAFVSAIQQSIANRPDEPGEDAATWTPTVTEADEPVAQTSRRPRMTYLPWRKSQLVMLGATAGDEHYWQCPHTGCKVWAGPYGDPITAKRAGFKHRYGAHR